MKAITFFFGIIVVMFVTMCNVATKPPERKSNIPSEAQWYGGKDGGVWIVVSSSHRPNSFNVVVYNENNGNVIVKGLYRASAECSNGNLTVEEVRKYINAFDGEKILLQKIKQDRYCTLEFVE